jgi:hypothetical protein
MTRRTDLSFADFDEVLADVDRLLAGHITVGAWSLGQILNHLATAIRLTTEGHHRSAGATREQDVARRSFFGPGRFPEGMQAPLPVLLPRPDLDAEIEAQALRETIGRFVSFGGELPAHPRLGPLTRDEWTRFHRIHCAHHLGFAVPR